MTHKLEHRTRVNSTSPLSIGPRVRRDIEHGIRELAGRFQPSPADLKELHKLRVFLHLLRTGGDAND